MLKRGLFLLLVLPLFLAAKEDPVQWTLAAAGGKNVSPGGKAYFELKATIEPGWHLYSPTTPPGGPIVTTIRVDENPAVTSFKVYRSQPVRKLDPNFQSIPKPTPDRRRS